MADSIRERVIQEIDYQLSLMTTANGFNTNAGSNKERGRKSWEDTDAPCMSIFPGVETATRTQYRTEKMTMPLQVDVLDTYLTTETASEKGERVLADIREAMHSVLKRPDGCLSEDVIYTGGGIQEYPEASKRIIGVTATFNVIYQTRIGDPYTQI